MQLVLAGIAGAIAGLGFEPTGLWPLTLLAYAWLISATIVQNSVSAAWRKAWAFGLGSFAVGLAWLPEAFSFQDSLPEQAGWAALVLLSAYLAIYTAVPFVIAGRLNGPPLARIGALASAWTAAEWLRGWLFTGFPWNQLGIIWIDVPFVSPMASWVGALGLSAWTILLASSLALLREERLKGAGLLAGCFALMVLSHQSASSSGDIFSKVRASVVQPNIRQSEKWRPELAERHLEQHLSLSGSPGSAALPRLLFWPEAAIPYQLEDDIHTRRRISRTLGPRDLLLTGGTYISKPDKSGRQFATNSMYVLNSSGAIVARYDKAHLVPFGEYLPLRNLLSIFGLTRFATGTVDFKEGAGPQTIQLPNLPSVAPAICYEIIFPGAVINKNDRPAFIFNPSNDGWFGLSGPPQHLAQARMRSIEEGLPTIRATTTGISAIIGSDGAILASLKNNRAGKIDGPLPDPGAPTMFSEVGNRGPLGIAALTALALLLLNFSQAAFKCLRLRRSQSG